MRYTAEKFEADLKTKDKRGEGTLRATVKLAMESHKSKIK
jgi:hypothetical protein